MKTKNFYNPCIAEFCLHGMNVSSSLIAYVDFFSVFVYLILCRSVPHLRSPIRSPSVSRKTLRSPRTSPEKTTKVSRSDSENRHLRERLAALDKVLTTLHTQVRQHSNTKRNWFMLSFAVDTGNQIHSIFYR